MISPYDQLNQAANNVLCVVMCCVLSCVVCGVWCVVFGDPGERALVCMVCVYGVCVCVCVGCVVYVYGVRCDLGKRALVPLQPLRR